MNICFIIFQHFFKTFVIIFQNCTLTRTISVAPNSLLEVEFSLYNGGIFQTHISIFFVIFLLLKVKLFKADYFIFYAYVFEGESTNVCQCEQF
jgi:hypothetical protein